MIRPQVHAQRLTSVLNLLTVDGGDESAVLSVFLHQATGNRQGVKASPGQSIRD
jgi:hypothetical protein